ncbi:MAG: hypothetical protein ACRCX8_08675 [Sarcina sp.]
MPKINCYDCGREIEAEIITELYVRGKLKHLSYPCYRGKCDICKNVTSSTHSIEDRKTVND